MLIWFDLDIILCIYSKKIKNKHYLSNIYIYYGTETSKSTVCMLFIIGLGFHIHTYSFFFIFDNFEFKKIQFNIYLSLQELASR